MKKNIKLFLIFVFFGLIFSKGVFAENFFIEGQIIVPDSCQIKDAANNVHNFPKENSPSGFLGICAIFEAKESGLITNFEFIDFGFGLFLDSINGVRTSGDWDLSWSIYLNDEYAQVGLADLLVNNGDKLSFIYTSYSTGQEFDKLILHILTEQNSSSASSQNSAGIADHYFSVEKAIRYLAENQRQDGSFGNPLFTDWVALAFSAYDINHPAVFGIKNYLISNPDPGESFGSPVLSFIRRAMALMALYVDPYYGTKINYIQKIVDSFDGKQIGSVDLVNDDIFALLVLRKAGFSLKDSIIQKTTDFILKNQKQNGSWEGSVDITAAALQSLSLVSDIKGVQEAMDKGKRYIINKQQDDGGFGNAESTSWALQSSFVFGEDWRNLKKNGNSPYSYLFYLQKIKEGYIISPSPIWSTAYVIPAALGKSWPDILHSFSMKDNKLDSVSVNQNLPQDNLLEISFELEQIKEKIAQIDLGIKIIFAKNQLNNLFKLANYLKNFIESLGMVVENF